MSNLYFHFNETNRTSGMKRLQDVLDNVDDGDVINVIFPYSTTTRARNVIDFFNENGFNHLVKGDHEGKSYSIIAHRKL
ncbi:MAG: hypothetical protein FH753_07930 [Firmicutes bacterium]|nr:hypothetical protein [Bacillota bacterium]